MFDINAIVNAAIAEAVNSRITEMLQQHADIVAALAERIAALEDQAIVTSNAIDKRVTALENNPAQGVDTQAAPTTDITQHIIDALSDIEHPLFKRMSSFMDAAAEQAMDHHLECYDHDSYDSAVSAFEDMPDFDDFVTRDSVREEIEDVINNSTISIRA